MHYAQTVHLVAPRAELWLAISVEQALKDGVLPARTESIIGTPREPVSLILSPPDDAALLDIMAAAGWQVSDPPSIRTLSRAAVAAWLNRPHDTTPITPVFWNGWPQDFGFERSVPAKAFANATCLRESVLPIRPRPDFSVVFEGYAGEAERCHPGPEARK